MSGGNCPETPRQKMIGMMYLVLTALLALNVSKDILDAFVIVDEGLATTTKNFVNNNKKLYADFGTANTNNPDKVGPYYNKAIEIQKASDKMYKSIQDLKIEIVELSEGKDSEAIHEGEIIGAKINGKDDTNKPAQIMIGDNNDKAAKELKKKFDDFRNLLLTHVDDKELKLSISQNLNTDDVQSHSDPTAKEIWERHNFEHLPLMAVITIMTKMQSNIRNAEADAINYLYSNISADDIPVNKIDAIVKANSNYVISGGKYKAEIFLAASDSTSYPEIFVGKEGCVNYETLEMVGVEGVDYKKLDSLNNGKGVYEVSTGGSGNPVYEGLIKLKTKAGTRVYPFKETYQVAQASLVISPTKMNVFYTKVDNPVEISVPGVPSDKIFPSMSGGTIKRASKGGYIVKPNRTGKAKISVSAEINGERKPMGSKEFRVRNVPKPIAAVGGKSDGSMNKAILLAQQGVEAKMDDFVFDLKFRVTKFSVSAKIGGYNEDAKTTGNKFNAQQKALLRRLKRGDRLIIEDISAQRAGATPVKLKPIVLKIK